MYNALKPILVLPDLLLRYLLKKPQEGLKLIDELLEQSFAVFKQEFWSNVVCIDHLLHMFSTLLFLSCFLASLSLNFVPFIFSFLVSVDMEKQTFSKTGSAN